MEFKLGDKCFYRSSFDEKTGIIVREVEVPKLDYYGDFWGTYKREDREAFNERFGWRREAFSPVPETVDLKITGKCPVNCPYCYMDSLPKSKHAPKDLAAQVIKGFDTPPYQMAIGGGEPTLHPDFPEILRSVRELGTVPNYTTAGLKLTPEVVEATNEVCGGVAMTYHAFKGLDWFVKHYCDLRVKLPKIQLNVHLIFDQDVCANLRALISRKPDIGPLNLVLLAYYPDVGRASHKGLPSKAVYHREFPAALREAQEAGYQVAFSEGLMPYFISRPELGVNTDFAMRSEGRFACYFDAKGRISNSSFNPPWKEGPTVWDTRSQVLWEKLYTCGEPNGDACYECKFNNRCTTPHDVHYLLCAFAEHNRNK
jgi:hypothetical protein